MPPRSFTDVKDVAEAQAAANGWAVTVEHVLVDGQEAAFLAFSEVTPALAFARAMASEAAGASAAPVHAATLGGPGAPSAFEKRLANVALGDYDAFRFRSENDPGPAARIKQY